MSTRRRHTTIAVTAVGAIIAGIMTLGFQGHAGTAAAAEFSSLAAPPAPAASSDPVLQNLEKNAPNINLASARTVLSDASGTVYLTTGLNGDVCLVEKVAQPANTDPMVASRYACKKPADVAKEGILGGVPGSFYVAAPDPVQEIVVVSNGKTSTVSVPHNAVRLPPGTSSITVGTSGAQRLPTPSGG